MRHAPLLLVLLALVAAPGAQADVGDTVLGAANLVFGVMASVPGTVDHANQAATDTANATLTSAVGTAIGAVAQATQLETQTRASAFVAIGSSTEYVDAVPCGEVKAVVENDKKPVEPRLVLVLTPGNDTQRCPAQTLQWRSNQLQGDQAHGWDGAYVFGATLHRIHIGAYGDGNHVAMHWTATRGRAVVGEWVGYLVNVA